MSEVRRDTIPLGAVDPYHLRFDLTNTEVDPADVSFLDVVSAEFKTTTPSGTVVTWVAQIESVSVTNLRIAYAFQAGDLDSLGEYQVRPELTTSSGGLLFGSLQWFTVVPV